MRAPFFALLTLSALGCAAPTHQPAVMRIDGVCVKTACDVKPRRDWCSECLSACAASRASCNPDAACAASCSAPSTSCTEKERNTCVEKRFTAYVPLHGDAAIEDACHRSMDRNVACGAKVMDQVDSFCAAFSRVAVPEVVGLYDCLAGLSCGEEDICPQPSAPEGIAPLEADECARTHLATSYLRSGLYKPDVLGAALRCLDESSCNDVRHCLDAWVNAVH